MDFEWDEAKARSIRRKHGVDFADAVSVLSDDHVVTIPDEQATEARFITIGLDALGRVLVVVYAWRGERIRIISAKKATTFERAQYGR